MTRREELEHLRDAVKSGTLHTLPYGGMPTATACYARSKEDGLILPETFSDGCAVDAYHGNAGAAMKLLAKVLPNWSWECGTLSQSATVYAPDYPGEDLEAPSYSAQNPVVARALLVATLDAVIAQEPDAPMTPVAQRGMHE